MYGGDLTLDGNTMGAVTATGGTTVLQGIKTTSIGALSALCICAIRSASSVYPVCAIRSAVK